MVPEGGRLLKMVVSFLSDLSLWVVLDGFTSLKYPIKTSAIQGSMLLFTLHMNDMGAMEALYITDKTPQYI